MHGTTGTTYGTTGTTTTTAAPGLAISSTGYTEDYDEYGQPKIGFGAKIKGAFHNMKEKITGHHDVTTTNSSGPLNENYTETGIDPVTGQKISHSH
jgi:hypothetical protein